MTERQQPTRKLRHNEGPRKSIFPEFDVTVPMPAGTAVPPQLAIAAGPLNLAILLADAAGDAVDVARLDAEMTCVLRTTNFATFTYDVEIAVTAEGALSFGDSPGGQASAVSRFRVAPGIVHVSEFALKAREKGPGALGFTLRYRPDGFPTWSIWNVGGPIAVEIQ
jgi:hypothetical protein